MVVLAPVSFEKHGKKKLLPLKSYSFAAKQHMAPLLPTEFALAAHCFPIVFVKQQDKFSPLGLLGLKAESNLLVDNKGRWLADYVPAIFRRYPFAFARPGAADNTKFVLCIDESSDLLADDGGEALFTAQGKQSQVLDNALKFVTEFQKRVPASEKLCELLQNLDLLVPFNIKLKQGDKTVNIEGTFRVDEKKLNALSDEDFLSVRSAGILPLIYAHLFSLNKVSVLTDKLRNVAGEKKTKTKIAPMPESFKF